MTYLVGAVLRLRIANTTCSTVQQLSLINTYAPKFTGTGILVPLCPLIVRRRIQLGFLLLLLLLLLPLLLLLLLLLLLPLLTLLLPLLL
jgi:hypothetical protein